MRRRMIRRALLVLPATALALTSGLASAQVASSTGWRRVAIVSQPSMAVALFSVGVADRRHAWAVGIAAPTSGNGQPAPVVESWNGSTWTPVSLPANVVAKLGFPLLTSATAAPGSRPVSMWAFTVGGGWLHLRGTTWTAGQITRRPVFVLSSLAFGRSNVWAFGGAGLGPKFAPYATHLGAKGWKRTLVPGTGMIADASAVSSADIWAVVGSGGILGIGGSPGGLVHFFRGRWHRVASLPALLRNGSLGSVLARSDKNVWVGGAVKNSKRGTTEAIGHWNGRRWTVVRLRAAASAGKFRVISMVTDGVGGVWALGLCESATCNLRPSRLWHEKAGRWSRPVEPTLASTPVALVSLTAVAQSVWAAGIVQAAGSTNGLIALWGKTP